MIWLWIALLLHPGHMTRLDIGISEDLRNIEVAMRIDSADLEWALKSRHQRAYDLLEMSDPAAEQVLGDYLRETITLNEKKLAKAQFRWVGWQKHPRHVWLYFELPRSPSDGWPSVLRIRSLFEVEPELRHVVVLDKSAGDRTVILSNPDQPLRIDPPGKSNDPGKQKQIAPNLGDKVTPGDKHRREITLPAPSELPTDRH